MARLIRTPLCRLNIVLLMGIGLLVFAALAGCAPGVDTQAHDSMKMASLDSMPAEVQQAPVTVQESYRFAAANPDTLKQIPCYCGCGAEGHTSNYSCYVSGMDEKGNITYDGHGLGCSICVDITQDVMRQLKQGRSVTEIRTAVDQAFSKYGPSNMQ